MIRAKNRLGIAIIAPSLRKIIGGQEVQADLLLRGWVHDVDVTAHFVPTNEPLPLGILERIRYCRTVCRFPRYLFLLWRTLSKADIAHIFSAASWSFVIATLPAYTLSRLLRKRIIIHYHSPWGEVHLRSSVCARMVLQHADLVVVPSSYYVEVFRRFSIVAHCIPNIVDAALCPYRHRKPLRPFLLSSRNLEPYCGVDNVIRAFAEVQQQIPDARLTIAGTGSQERAIRDLIAELKLRRVRLAGRISRERMGEIYNEADILINASRADNMPVSLMEAFVAGLPVVTTNAGGISHFVQHYKTGLLCDPDDWHALADSIVRLIQTPGLADRLSENAHKQACLYRWDVVRQQWLNAYHSVLRASSLV